MLRIAALTLLLATPASAQSLQQRLQVGQAWEAALSEWSVLLTCSMFEPQSREMIERAWTPMRDDTLDIMAEAGWPEAGLTELRTRAELDAMRLPGDTPLSEVVAYCNDSGDWMRGLQMMTITMLDHDVEAALE